MKMLISINNKFYNKTPWELIELINHIDTDKVVYGFEICTNINSKKDVDYSLELAYLCKKHNYYLQMHGDSSLPIEDQKRFIIHCESLSEILDYDINVVLHPISSENVDESIILTNNYFFEVLKFIEENNYNVNITIENLNANRLVKEQLLPIVANNIKLGFTYDIGHEIINFGQIIDLDPVLEDRLSNVHLHTHDYFQDHKTIFNKDKNKSEWVKGLLYLKKINYTNTIVLEYDFYKTAGDSYEEKLENYIASAKLIFQYFY